MFDKPNTDQVADASEPAKIKYRWKTIFYKADYISEEL